MSLTAIRVPVWVHLKAINTLRLYHRRKVHSILIRTTGNLSIRVCRRWRLLSRDNGRNWEVMSHERYNRVKDMK